jgi:hypothetical protein
MNSQYVLFSKTRDNVSVFVSTNRGRSVTFRDHYLGRMQGYPDSI